MESLDFKDHYVICPSLVSNGVSKFKKNKIGENGKKVKENFEYSSDSNSKFLSKDQIIKYNIKV